MSPCADCQCYIRNAHLYMENLANKMNIYWERKRMLSLAIDSEPSPLQISAYNVSYKWTYYYLDVTPDVGN